jgi:hydrogenase maturation protein HypF
MLQRGLNCPVTSSMGRLFDAAAGLLGVNEVQAFEAQAAVLLQQLAQQYGPIAPLDAGYLIGENNVLDFSPLLAVLADCSDACRGAALFHATIAQGLAQWAELAAARHGIKHVALGGGCFYNAILQKGVSDRLTTLGLHVLISQQPGDSSISLGQAWVAVQSVRHQSVSGGEIMVV